MDFEARNELRKTAILLLSGARRWSEEHPEVNAQGALAAAYRDEIERLGGDPTLTMGDGTETFDSLALAWYLAGYFVSISDHQSVAGALEFAENHLETDRSRAQ